VDEVHDLYFVTGWVLSGYQIEKGDMGWTSGTYGTDYKYMRCFNREPEVKRILGTSRNKKGRIILKLIIKCRMEWHGLG
jgi:hypothetical protein